MKQSCVFVLLLAGIWSISAQERQAVILGAQGTVEIQDEGLPEWRAVTPGDTLGKNAVISTGFKSNALVSLGDSRLSILPLTRLTLEELVQRDAAEEAGLYLRTGRVRADVRPPAGSRTDFTVRPPIATASVRGTDFEFDTRHLYVDNGRVLLEGSNGQMVYVEGGQRSYIDESEQRVIPPFEAEAALLTPTLSELTNTGSNTGSYAPLIKVVADLWSESIMCLHYGQTLITAPEVNLSPLGIEAEWP
jgi:hypothetical protein